MPNQQALTLQRIGKLAGTHTLVLQETNRKYQEIRWLAQEYARKKPTYVMREPQCLSTCDCLLVSLSVIAGTQPLCHHCRKPACGIQTRSDSVPCIQDADLSQACDGACDEASYEADDTQAQANTRTRKRTLKRTEHIRTHRVTHKRHKCIRRCTCTQREEGLAYICPPVTQTQTQTHACAESRTFTQLMGGSLTCQPATRMDPSHTK